MAFTWERKSLIERSALLTVVLFRRSDIIGMGSMGGGPIVDTGGGPIGGGPIGAGPIGAIGPGGDPNCGVVVDVSGVVVGIDSEGACMVGGALLPAGGEP
jgi:hypothetical protein